ncbi:MAG: hypothetical protein EBR18_01795 [Betaproteobacteria bacterium]|nr:hypothetical protein [Betaproteobacteria bacterium]
MNTSLVLKGERKWLPIPVIDFERHLQQLIAPASDFNEERCVALRKNVAYSLQYLEFLHRCGVDLAITSVIQKQNSKAFIIVGCGILEALFCYILVANGKAAKTEWQTAKKFTTQEFELNGKRYRSEIEHREKRLTPELEPMSFDAMCKRIEKHDLTKLGSEKFYKHLRPLRTLRNRVHIHDVYYRKDTDWEKFNKNDLTRVKSVLLLLLQSSFFEQKNADRFYFLSE